VCGVKRTVRGGLKIGSGEERTLTTEVKNAYGGRRRGECGTMS